jgi:uncharacterized protein
MTKILSASRLNDYLGCAHQSALWLAGADPDEETDATLELVRAKGFAHEAVVLAELEKQYGPAVRVSDKGALADRQAETLKALKDGAPLIYQGAFSNGRWLGFPDFLVRKTMPDGGTTYEPEDAKLARTAKAEHVLQLGVYADLLQELAGLPVAGAKIHVSGGPAEEFDLRATRHILKRLMRGFERFASDGNRVTRPVPCVACSQCDFKGRCEQEWRAADSPFFVAGLNAAQLLKLEASGITTLAGLASMSASTKIAGIGDEPLARLGAQARIQHAAREKGTHATELLPIVKGRGFCLLPPPDKGDLYFDMEGDPLYEGGLEYLFGIWGPIGESGAEAFVPIWAHDRDAEKEAFEKLMRLFTAHFARHPTAHVYHYAHYEPAALKRLAMRHATMEAELDQMLRDHRFVDLYRVVRQGLRASTEGYSLKDLEKIYWDAREGEVTTAADSIVEYERWCVSRDDAILESIAAYNRHDFVSTAHMHRWLEQMRPQGAVYGIADEEDEDGKITRSADREAMQARKLDLARRVRASALGDEALRELVAELLWFHQRAQKPGWWAVFERQAWSDEELTDDAESIGGVTRDASVTPIPVKRSLDTTYRFAPQDTKLKVGDRPKVAATRAPAGTISAIDPEEGRVVLRRGANAPPLPGNFGLIPAPIDQQGLPVAVMAFAERFAAGDLRGDQALMDILQRRPPRFKTRATGMPVLGDGEDLMEGTVRAALDLDCSALFVQGPPGTGKTYTIGGTIVALLKKGHRVGVTSNSHKAVHEVLLKVEEHAVRGSFHFVGVKKATKDHAETEFTSAHISTVYRSEDVATAHRLVGGTTFHFCREDQRSAFDYLIVDEAGQVALGNLVAVAGAARNIILVGDQMQLPQPVQGVHPGETGFSSLEYLLLGRATVSPELGILLNESWRMHPSVCAFISEAIYDGRLSSRPETGKRSLVLDAGAHPVLLPAGLAMLQLDHEGFTQGNPDEADAIAEIMESLLKQRAHLEDGTVRKMRLEDVLVVAPYNMQVNTLRQRLPEGARVGTVDKFQGQQALAVIVSMTTSRGDEAPRGTEFLFNPNRLNVALSRAQCLAVVVCGKRLLDGQWKAIADLARLNLLAHVELIANATKR